MDRWLTRMTIALAVLLAAVLVLTTAIGFFCYALYAALLGTFSTPAAAALTGVAALIVAGLIIVVGQVASQRTERRTPKKIDNAADIGQWANELGTLLGKKLGTPAGASTPMTVAIALVAGLAVGAFPSLRHTLRDILDPSP